MTLYSVCTRSSLVYRKQKTRHDVDAFGRWLREKQSVDAYYGGRSFSEHRGGRCRQISYDRGLPDNLSSKRTGAIGNFVHPETEKRVENLTDMKSYSGLFNSHREHAEHVYIVETLLKAGQA